MGIINEIKHIYDALNTINKYELNEIIAERIAMYSYSFLNEDYICEIKKEFGSVESFANILAENFTRNNGSFDNLLINEGIENESLWGGLSKLFKGGKRILKNGGKGILRKITGKPTGRVVERFGKQELDNVAKFVGKRPGNVGHMDIAKYVTNGMTKNANRDVARQLEKQAAWLSKNTSMNTKQMSEFMQKYSYCPSDCDPKLWKQAFEEEAKLFRGGINLEKGLVRSRYNALARAAGKTSSRQLSSMAGRTTITRRMLNGVKKITKGIWKFVKVGGIILLLAGGVWYFWDDIKGWIQKMVGNTGGSNYYTGNSLNGLYPKIYGKDYIGENPEDYRII